MHLLSQTGAGFGAHAAPRHRPSLRFAAAAVFGLSMFLGPVAGRPGEAAARTPDAETQQHLRPPIPIRATTPEARPRATTRQRATTQEARRPRPQRPAPAAAPRAEARPAQPLPSIRPAVFTALQTAAGASSIDRALLFALAWRESRFDPRADNPASSARGLMQFTRAAWLESIRDHGAAHGLAPHAAAILTDRATGEVTVRNPRQLTEILALRDDPHLSVAMTIARIERNRDRLAAGLGRPVTDADLYLTHFLGSAGAQRFLQQLARTPSHRASDYVEPAVVAANRSVFITASGRHRSLREVHASIGGELEAQRPTYARVLQRMDGMAIVELASAD